MKGAEKDLQRIRGVGEVLARRLVEHGIDSYGKIVAAGPAGLAGIRGMNPRAIPSILAQAEELAAAGTTMEELASSLRETASRLRTSLVELAGGMRDRFGDRLAGRKGARLEKEILRVTALLESLESRLPSRPKKTGKALAKADRRFSGLGDCGIKKTARRLKKTRKSLQKAGT